MKTRIPLLAAMLVAALISPCSNTLAQGTTFTYQGRLNNGGNPANGIYDLRFTIYDSTNILGVVVAGPLTSSGVAVSNGLFTVPLDFGAAPFNGADRWMQIDLRTNGGGFYTALSPMQQLTPTPYAITARSVTGVIPGGGVSGLYSNQVIFNNPSNTFAGALFAGTFIGNGGGLTGVNASSFSGLGTGNFWQTVGNAGTTAGVNFLGTTDNQPLELKAAGQRALRLEPNTVLGAPNVIGGSADNSVDGGIVGATVAGGGSSGFPNRVGAIYAAISGGRKNFVGADHSTIGGGHDNTIGALSYDSVIAGGAGITIESNAVQSAIGGGQQNFIGTNSFYAVIGGGSFNAISNGGYATISGGGINIAQSIAATIGGGFFNGIQKDSSYSTIGGGDANSIDTNNFAGTIGGGAGNHIGPSVNNGTIGGGYGNNVYAIYGTISGGRNHTLLGDHAVIGGGHDNSIALFAYDAVIAGGAGNSIGSSAQGAGIASGQNNFVGASEAVIDGGNFNTITTNGSYGTISGGYLNSVNGAYGWAGGRRAKAIHNGAFVWADSQDADFASSKTNQFLIRANGGVGIGTATTPPGGLRVHTGGLAVTGASSPSYGTNAGVYIEYGTAGNVFAFDYGPFLPRPLVLNAPGGLVGVVRVPTANALEVEGNASKTVAGSWLANSDARIKKDIEPVSGALEKLERVRLVSFHYTDDYRQAHPSVENRRYLNVVAQEFREVFPEEVKSSREHLPNSSEEILQVDTYPLVIYSAAAIQELNRKLESQRTELERKETELDDLKRRLEDLEKIVRGEHRTANAEL